MATTLTGRLLNQRQMAEIMGVSTEAVRNWVSQGCPTHRGDKGARLYLPSEVINWRQERAMARAMAEQDVSDLDESKRRKLAAEAAIAEIDLAERRGRLAEVRLIEDRLVRALGACRARLLGVGAKAAPLLVLASGAAAMKQVVDEAVAEALEEIADGALDLEGGPAGADRSGDPFEPGGDEAAAEADDQ